ncbi:MAG: hypothetical protein V4613_08865 [Bacteroidota bacterium]
MKKKIILLASIAVLATSGALYAINSSSSSKCNGSCCGTDKCETACTCDNSCSGDNCDCGCTCCK